MKKVKGKTLAEVCIETNIETNYEDVKAFAMQCKKRLEDGYKFTDSVLNVDCIDTLSRFFMYKVYLTEYTENNATPKQ